jgi:hypothetical protein
MKGELRWMGANSISKFDHHNIYGGTVDDTWRHKLKTCKLNLLMRYQCRQRQPWSTKTAGVGHRQCCQVFRRPLRQLNINLQLFGGKSPLFKIVQKFRYLFSYRLTLKTNTQFLLKFNSFGMFCLSKFFKHKMSLFFRYFWIKYISVQHSAKPIFFVEFKRIYPRIRIYIRNRFSPWIRDPRGTV